MNADPRETTEPPLTGRAGELMVLSTALGGAKAGQGQSILVLGEAGVGKSRLVDEFVTMGCATGALIFSGVAAEGEMRPFAAFSEALSGLVRGELFSEEEFTGFCSVLLMDGTGALLAKARDDRSGLDAETFTGMLAAVQSFVRDSFGAAEHSEKTLGKLVYGDMMVLTERGDGVVLTGLVRGPEHADMRRALSAAAAKLETAGDGRPREAANTLDGLARLRFEVRKNLESVKFEDEMLRKAEHVLETLSAAARERPVLLLVEDMHWADASSLFLFSYLARNIAAERILLVGTARPEGGPDFTKFHGTLLAEGTAAELELGGLDESGVRAMLDHLLPPNDLPDEFCNRLAADSKGNPLFIGETVRQMVDDGGIVFERGAYALAREDYALPRSAEEAVRRRLERLDPDAMALAEYASCIGLSFGKDILWSLASMKEPESCLERLCGGGILYESVGTVSFSHSMFRKVTYDTISNRWKRAYHRSLGEYYERTSGPEPGDAVFELARHFSACGETAKAHDYCLRAGQRAENSYAPELARQFYSSALDTLSPTAGDRPRGMLLDKLADSERALGMLAEAKRDYAAAMRLLEGSDSEKMDVLLKLSGVMDTMSESDSAAGMLEGALHLAGQMPPALGCQIMSRLGLARACGGDENGARHLSERTLERASEIPNIRVKVAVYTTLGQVFDRIGPEELAVRMLNLAVSEAEESGDLISLATAYHEIGAYMHYRGESAAASGLFEKAVAYLEKRGDIAQLARAIVYLGMAYSDCGELDKSLASLRRALALNRKMGHGLSTASILGNIGYTLAMMGRHEESLSHQEESLQIRMKQNSPDGMGWSYYDMSLVHGQMGELGRAVECLDKASECFVSTGNDIGLTYAKAAKADLLAEMGDGSTAESLYREVLDVAERKSMGTEQFQALTALADLGALVPDKAVPRLREIAKRMARLSTAMALEDFLGRLSAAAGERDAAEGHFAAGLDMANGKTGMEADIGSAGILLSRAGARLSHGKNNLAAADAAEAARLFRKWGRFREARKAEALRDAAPPKI